MSGVSTKISVADAMTPAIEHMYRGVSQLISGLYKLNEASGNAIDVSPFLEAQKSMAEAVAVQRQLEKGYAKVAESTRQAQSAQNLYNESIKEAEKIQNTFKWNRINGMEIFSDTDIERYRKELEDFNSLTERIKANQQEISSNVMNSLYNGIYPRADSGAFTDFNSISSRISELMQRMSSVSAIDISGFTTANQAVLNSEVETLRAYEREVLNVQASLSRNMSEGNVGGMNSDVEKLNDLSEQLETRMRGILSTAQRMGAVSWDNLNNVEVFNSTGIERAEQEANALRTSLENVVNTQRTLTENTMGMKLLPSNATSDITGLNSRIMSLRNALANMDAQKNKLSKWDTSGINRYNSNAEQLRRAMAQIEGIQNDINRAIADNDIDRVNIGYQRLSSIVNNVEHNIRDNTTEQDRFNRSISTGANNALRLGDNLTNGIRRYITMAASAYSGKQIINASDTWTNNSSRLGLITDNLQEQNVLQQKLYQSAKDTRGAYSDMVDVTAKLGLLAGDAFGSNAELVKFTELMQKSFKLSGAGTQERQSAMYQLTQAMASGKLQGDEFRSIMENAPMLANAIAEYTGVSKGELKELSSDGVITADIIKNALFMAADDIESKFETMPLTFGEAWNNIASDATMAFAPVYEMMNNALNSALGENALTGITSGITWLAGQAQQAGQWIGDIAEQAAPALSQLSGDIQGIVSDFAGVGGVINTVSQNIVTAFGSAGARTSIRIYANAIGSVAIGLSSILNVMTPLLPYVTTTYIMFKSYQTLTSIFNTISPAIQGVSTAFSTVTTSIEGATVAQRTFNAVCNTNVFAAIASAVLGIATAWSQVAEQEKYAAQVAVANNNINTALQSGIDNVSAGDYAKANGVDLNTAKSILAVEKEYQEQIQAIKDEQNAKRYVTDTYYGQYDKYLDDSYMRAITEVGTPEGDGVASSIKNFLTNPIGSIADIGTGKGVELTFDMSRVPGSDYNNTLAESNRRIAELESQMNAQVQAYKNDYIDMQEMLEEMNDLKAGDGSLDVGDVDNVNHINDTVDIASEDLKFLRDLADQETINQFTSKLLQPQINVSFGEVRETADVDEIIQRITDGLAEDLNNSGDLVHI